jgi:hypothetical protein
VARAKASSASGLFRLSFGIRTREDGRELGVQNHGTVQMTYKHISILIVILSIISALGWDGWMLATGLTNDTWSEAVRDLNKWSTGLVMGGAFVLFVHLFFNQWFPVVWGGGQ